MMTGFKHRLYCWEPWRKGKNESLREVLQLPEHLKIMYVIALGKPKETVVLEEMKDGDYKYWRETDGSHHVPKRALEELVIL